MAAFAETVETEVMRNRGRGRGKGGRRPGVSVDAAHAILSVTQSGGDPTVGVITTTAPHGLSLSQQLVITGTSKTGYNIAVTVDSIPSANTFTSGDLFWDVNGDAAGGFWRPA